MQKIILITLILLPFSLFSQKKCEIDDFTGTQRKMAKTSIVTNKNVETFADLPGFITTLPDDKSMKTRKPPITNAPYFARVAEEERSVKIKEAYVYAITRQADNDFLIILGSAPDYTNSVFFFAEVSGLPESSKESYSTLNTVRSKFKEQFGNVCGKTKLLMDNPVKISISGSLLFDINIKPGKTGPKKLRPTTAWEIHPVSEIVFK